MSKNCTGTVLVAVLCPGGVHRKGVHRGVCVSGCVCVPRSGVPWGVLGECVQGCVYHVIYPIIQV